MGPLFFKTHLANNNKNGIIKCFRAEGERDGEGADTETEALAFRAKILDTQILRSGGLLPRKRIEERQTRSSLTRERNLDGHHKEAYTFTSQESSNMYPLSAKSTPSKSTKLTLEIGRGGRQAARPGPSTVHKSQAQ